LNYNEFKCQSFKDNYEKILPFFRKYPILGPLLLLRNNRRVCILTFALHFLLLSKNSEFCRKNSDFFLIILTFVVRILTFVVIIITFVVITKAKAKAQAKAKANSIVKIRTKGESTRFRGLVKSGGND